jgi:hypothetical protein
MGHRTGPAIRRLQWLAVACLLFLGAACKGESRCPWLNVATASGVLNGPASLEVEYSAASGNVCVFLYQDGAARSSLQIVVRETKDTSKDRRPYESQCTSAMVPLRAIGNEAMLCAVDARNSHGEQVIGRVRDRLFIVGIRAGPRTPSMQKELLQEKAESISEQVAGALF